MGARFEGGARTKDCRHGLRLDSNRGNFGPLNDSATEKKDTSIRRCLMKIMAVFVKESYRSSMPDTIRCFKNSHGEERNWQSS